MNGIEIVPLHTKHYPDAIQVLNDGFGTKRAFCCLTNTKTHTEFSNSYKRRPEKKELAFVAVDTNNDAVLGYVQLSKPNVPAFWGLHTCAPNEVYVDQLGVSADARGRGVGTKLMDFCEEYARNLNGINVLTLDVLRGNRALAFYKRIGFEIIPPKSSIDDCFTNCFVWLVVGRPYGLCNSQWGVHKMQKKLI